MSNPEVFLTHSEVIEKIKESGLFQDNPSVRARHGVAYLGDRGGVSYIEIKSRIGSV